MNKKIFTFSVGDLYNICLKNNIDSKKEIIEQKFKSEIIINDYINTFIKEYKDFIIDYNTQINVGIGIYTVSLVIDIDKFLEYFNIILDRKLIDMEFKNIIYKYFGKYTLHIFTNLPYYYYLYLKEKISLLEYRILSNNFNELLTYIEKYDLKLNDIENISKILLQNYENKKFINILFLFNKKVIGYIFNNFIYYDINYITDKKDKDFILSLKNNEIIKLNINNIQYITKKKNEQVLIINTSTLYNNLNMNINLEISDNEENIIFSTTNF